MSKRRSLRPVLIAILVLLILTAGGTALYRSVYYPAGDAAQETLSAAKVSSQTGDPLFSLTVDVAADGYAFLPEEPVCGLIFYPGGLVDHQAYAPLMQALAREGVLCVVPRMPLALAVLDMNAADGITARYPQVDRWAIGGHSLGGAMAASYAADHGEDFSALVLLAAYATAKLPDSLSVVSVFGDADGVLNREKYAQYRSNLPADAHEILLSGGNHAQFGDYGEQKGDGAAAISAGDQIARTVQAILPLLTGVTPEP